MEALYNKGVHFVKFDQYPMTPQIHPLPDSYKDWYLIRSKLDYGCIVYGSARPSYIKMLNTIHHQGLRLALGTFRTSPVESLYVEAGELPLEERRIKLSLQYISKLKSTPSNPAYKCVFEPEFVEKYLRNTKTIKPLGIRMMDHLQAGDINLDQVNDEYIYDIPPWELSFPSVNLALTSTPKSKTLESDYRQRFLEIHDFYENKNFTSIYTDGSKSNDYVSASAVSPVDTMKVNLPTDTSIFTAEAVALKLAVQYIQSQTLRNTVIYSDSLVLFTGSFRQKLGTPYNSGNSSNFDIFKSSWVPD